ncbi:cobalamin biosynthesis protein CobG [Kytococcus sp. Marseille-QA3725]
MRTPNQTDRCPGLLRPHRAADGDLVRVRVPGGRLPAEHLARLADLAAEHGAPFLQLTSRGSLQLRGLPDPVPGALQAAVRDLGLLPSDSHERARTLVAAPDRGLDDLVEAVDAAVVACPDLAELPGRWLTVLSDVEGTHLDLPFDVAWQPLASREGGSPTDGELIAGGRRRPCSRGEAPGAVVALARRFLARRADAGTWNVRDLSADSPVLDDWPAVEDGQPLPTAPGRPLQPGRTADGRDLVVAVPLGLLTPAHAEAIAAAWTDDGPDAGTVVVTPSRSVVLRDAPTGAEEALQDASLLTEPDHPLCRVTACIGAPSCARTEVRTLDLTRQAVEQSPTSASGPAVHVVGCDRACGRPAGATVVLPTSPDDVTEALRAHA